MTSFKKLVSMFVVMSFVVGFVFAANAYSAEKAASSSDAKKSDKININTAGVDQLKKLPRIGEKMANRVIDYRKKNGKFKKLEDLMKVRGIGEKTFKGFEGMITI